MISRQEEYDARITFLFGKDPYAKLAELLAVLHGDGGHFMESHGVAEAIVAAEHKHYILIGALEEIANEPCCCEAATISCSACTAKKALEEHRSFSGCIISD